jgi:serine/threonine protein kinase
MKHQDPLIGQRLANYQVERLLGQGGMASVYLGWDERLLRPVAIKVINERYRDDPVFTARFLGEARAAAAWRHPNILQIYYADEQDGLLYFVMEYVRGLDLEKILGYYASSGELIPPQDVLSIGRAVASALDYAHSQGVIHRDVKPANVILEEDGRVVLADFGLARKLSQDTMGLVFGSPHYISPEQARNSAEAEPRSDLYSFGVILYEALTGQVPFDDPSPTALALQHIVQEPPAPRSLNPSLSPAVAEVLLKALSKTPEGRYHTGKELMKALEAADLSGVDALSSAAAPSGLAAPSSSLSRQAEPDLLLHASTGPSPGGPPLSKKPVSTTRALEVVTRHLALDPEANPPTLSYARPPHSGAGAQAGERPAAGWPEAGLPPAGLPAAGALFGGSPAAGAPAGGPPASGAPAGGLHSPSPERQTWNQPDEARWGATMMPAGLPAGQPAPRQGREGALPGRSGWSAGLPAAYLLGFGALLLMAAIAGVFILAMVLDRAGATAEPTEGSFTRQPAASPPSATSMPMGSAPETDTPAPTLETPAATAEDPALEVDTPAAEAPQGDHRLALFYNDSSLYIQNLSGRDLPITPLAFERLDAEGQVLGRLRGQYWAQIYPRFRAEYCIVTEIYGLEDYLRPAECRNRQVIVRTPTEEEEFLFWRSEGEASDAAWEFRVLWNGVEVGRCQISEGYCEVSF